MTQQARGPRVHERWAHLRFSVIGQLLAAPPAKGELKAAIEGLAGRTWQHPTTGEPVRFGFSTIEHWYYRACKERTDPVGVLRRKVRANAGRQHAISDAVRQAVLAQYAAHKSWSVQLHHDNLVALAETKPGLKPLPSYPTLRRFMKANGLDKRRRVASRRGQARRSRDPRLRGRVRWQFVALGLSSWIEEGPHRARRVGDADPVRRAR
jgi:putative transposase